MSIYTVYEPPLRGHESAPDPERFVFVRDGFSIWAFLLAPLWMLRHRLWLAFLGYVIIVVGDDLESAERRFFDAWVNKSLPDNSSVNAESRASSPVASVPRVRRMSSDVIGLFPQPGAPR